MEAAVDCKDIAAQHLIQLITHLERLQHGASISAVVVALPRSSPRLTSILLAMMVSPWCSRWRFLLPSEGLLLPSFAAVGMRVHAIPSSAREEVNVNFDAKLFAS